MYVYVCIERERERERERGRRNSLVRNVRLIEVAVKRRPVALPIPLGHAQTSMGHFQTGSYQKTKHGILYDPQPKRQLAIWISQSSLRRKSCGTIIIAVATLLRTLMTI